MQFKISSEVTIIGLVGVPMVIIIIYSFLTILKTQRITKEECNRLADLMYSEQIDFSKKHNAALVYQVNRQVQNVQWNVYAINRLLRKVLDGQVKQNDNYQEILIQVERTYNNTEDEEKLDIFRRNYLLVTSWYVRNRDFYEQLDDTEKYQLRNITMVNALLRPIMLERDVAYAQGVTRRFYIKNMYFGTQYDGMVIGPSANTTYRSLKNPASCPSGQIYDSRCRYWFNDTIHQPDLSIFITQPKLQYSDQGIPFLASVLCQRVEISPFSAISRSSETLGEKGSLYSVLCNNLELTAADTYFSNFNEKSSFKMLIDPSSQNAIYYSRKTLNKTNPQNLSRLELDKMTTREQSQLFQNELSKLYKQPILAVNKSLDILQINEDNYQLGFKFMRLMNPTDHENQTDEQLFHPYHSNNTQNITAKIEEEDEEKQKDLKEHYAILNTIWIVDKLKEPWKEGYSMNSAFILIDVLSRDTLSVAAQKMQKEINDFFYYNFIIMTVFFVFVILIVIQRFIRVFRLIIRPIKQLTDLLNNISLDNEDQLQDIIGDKQLALKSLKDLFLSEDTRILYESFVSLFNMLQFTQQNIFVETESQTLLHLNEQVVHFKAFKNYRALGICHNNLGFIHFNAQRYEEALQEFQKAIIYANYEVKIYEEENDSSLISNFQNFENQSSLTSEMVKNMSIIRSNYKNLIEQSKKKLSNMSASKFLHSSGASLFQKKMKKMKSMKQSKVKERGDIQNNEIESEQSMNDRGQKEGINQLFDEIKQNKSEFKIVTNSSIQKKSTQNTKEQLLFSQRVSQQKKQNSKQFSSSHSLRKNKSSEKKQNLPKRTTKHSSSQNSINKFDREFSLKKAQSQAEREAIQQSESPSKSLSNKSLQENDYVNLFYTLYCRKFNYAKSMFMLLSNKHSSTLKNMWIELEQILLELLEIGSQIALSSPIKYGEFNCFILLVIVSEQLQCQEKLQMYLKFTSNTLQDMLTEQIQQDVQQENMLNSIRTWKSQAEQLADDINNYKNEELLQNRNYIQDYLQKLILVSSFKQGQFTMEDEQNLQALIDREQLSSLIKKPDQDDEQHYSGDNKDKGINRIKVQKSIYDHTNANSNNNSNPSQINLNVVSSDLKKSFFSNQTPKTNIVNILNTVNQLSQVQIKSNILNSQFSNIEIVDKSTLSPLQAISPYRNKKSVIKKRDTTTTQKSQMMKQLKIVKLADEVVKPISISRQNSPLQESSQIQTPINQNQNRNFSNRPIISQLLNAQEQFKKETLKIVNSPKKSSSSQAKSQIPTFSKATNKISTKSYQSNKETQQKMSNQDFYEKKLKQKVQKRLKENLKQIKKNLQLASICQVKMPLLNPKSAFRNSFNYQHPDMVISRMVLIQSGVLESKGKLFEAAKILTEQLENSYYFDPSTRHRVILKLQHLFVKAKIQVPEQLKSIIRCYNKQILYKVGLISLCSSKINRFKAYLLTKQILSVILTKPQDQFGLIIYKQSNFLGFFQMMSIQHLNQLKEIVENCLVNIFKDQKTSSQNKKETQNQINRRESFQSSSNQQSLHFFKSNSHTNFPTSLTPLYNHSNVNQIRVQKDPAFFKSSLDDQSQSYLNDLPSIQSGFSQHLLKRKDSNIKQQITPLNQSFLSQSNISLQNISNIQGGFQQNLILTGDRSPFLSLTNQNQQIQLPSDQKLNGIRQALFKEATQTPNSNQNNVIKLQREYTPYQFNMQGNSISFQELDFKKKEFVSLDFVDEGEEDNYVNERKMASQNKNQKSNSNRNLSQLQESNTISDTQISQINQNNQNNGQIIQQQLIKTNIHSPFGSDPQSSRQSQVNSSSSEEEDDDNESQWKDLESENYETNGFYSLRDLEEDLQTEENIKIPNQDTQGLITSDQAFHLGIKKMILTHFYQENPSLFHCQVETQSQSNQKNKKIDYTDFNNFNNLCINKYIICITDSPEIPQKNERYQQLSELLYKLNIELLILQLNQSSQFEEHNFPLCDYINEKLVISIFYSEQKLLQYLYNNRQNQSILTLPLIVEYFQTNFLFVLTF